MNVDNPIVEYKKKNALTWLEMVKRTGISRPGLFHLVNKSPKQMGLVRLKTVANLMKLGIDLIAYIK